MVFAFFIHRENHIRFVGSSFFFKKESFRVSKLHDPLDIVCMIRFTP